MGSTSRRCDNTLLAHPQRIWAITPRFRVPLSTTGTGLSLAGITPSGSLESVPVFSTTRTPGAGLDLLAAAAAATSGGGTRVSTPLVARPGPYNPAAAIPAKVAKRILDLEFVEMAEVALDDDLQQTPGRPLAPARLPITEISQWVERFSVMAALLTSRFPDKAPELFAYQAAIVRAERNYEGKRWVTYDRQFRREALARKDLNWSVLDPRLYNEAFTGRARAIARCSYCLQDDHQSTACPKNPNRPMFGFFPDLAMWHPQQHAPSHAYSNSGQSPGQEICRRFNEGKCKKPADRCRYKHYCSICPGQHPAFECPRRAAGRNRSPPRAVPRAPPAQGQRY